LTAGARGQFVFGYDSKQNLVKLRMNCPAGLEAAAAVRYESRPRADRRRMSKQVVKERDTGIFVAERRGTEFATAGAANRITMVYAQN